MRSKTRQQILMVTPYTTPIVSGIAWYGRRDEICSDSLTVELKDVENSETSNEDTWISTEEQEKDINWDWEDETGELT